MNQRANTPTAVMIGTVVVMIAVFCYAYKDVIGQLVNVWMNDGNYSHGFFVPVIVGYFIYQKRHKLAETVITPFLPAFVVILVAGVLYVFGHLTLHGYSKYMSLLLMIVAMVWFNFGSAWIRRILIPLAFLVFMFPLPEIARRTVTYPLQILSSYISVKFLYWIGFPIYREGNIIQLPQVTLSVAEACSGLRSLVALTFLAAVGGYFILNRNVYRILLFLLAFPVAIVLNWTRIVGTVIMTKHWGVETAMGFFHNFSGMVIFVFASIIIGAVMVVLKNRENEATAAPGKGAAGPPRWEQMRALKPATLATTIGFLIALLGYGGFLQSLKPQRAIELEKFPAQIGDYRGKEGFIDPSVTDFSRVTSDRSLTYYHPDHPPISLYLGYYRTGAKQHGFPHGADVCLPGSGWQVRKKEKIPLLRIGPDAGAVSTVMKYVSTKSGNTQIMLTWMQYGTVVGTGSRSMRLKMFADTIVNMKYSDLTKVMVQTLQAGNETEAQATERLSRFVDQFYPELMQLIQPAATSVLSSTTESVERCS